MTNTELLFSKICQNNEVCKCGRKHSFSLKKLLLHEGAIVELPELIAELGDYKNLVMICDKNTYGVAGEKIENMIKVHTICLNPEGLHANEKGVMAAESMMPETCDLMLAVGSGTVHDITRYIAYKRGVDFVSVPTAASVDGFVSSVAAMTWEGVKKSFTAVSPIAMIADSKILAEAPEKLTAAGVGDLLGKYIALFDWKLGSILTGEYYCPEIVKLEEDALNALVDNISFIADGAPEALEILMYGLVLSGIAMQMAGNSRPASGAEHHISHCIEMEVFNEFNPALHGEKVGIATGIVSDVYHNIAELSAEQLGFSLSNCFTDDEMKKVFGKLYMQIKEENKNFSISPDMETVLAENWEKICETIHKIPTANEIRRLLQICHGSTTLEDIGLNTDIEALLLRYSPLVRNRLTLMRLMGYMKPNEK